MVLDTVLAAPVREELFWGFSREGICLGKEFPKDYLDLALAADEIYLSMEAELAACPRRTGDVLQKRKSAELTKPVCVSPRLRESLQSSD